MQMLENRINRSQATYSMYYPTASISQRQRWSWSLFIPQDFAETNQTRIAQILRLVFPGQPSVPVGRSAKLFSGNLVGSKVHKAQH